MAYSPWGFSVFHSLPSKSRETPWGPLSWQVSPDFYTAGLTCHQKSWRICSSFPAKPCLPAPETCEAPTVHSADQFSFRSLQSADEWAENMPKLPPPASPKEMANRDILARVHKAVTSHYYAISQEFENFDTMKSNTVSRDEFRSICTRHVQILTDEQVRSWSLTPGADSSPHLKKMFKVTYPLLLPFFSSSSLLFLLPHFPPYFSASSSSLFFLPSPPLHHPLFLLFSASSSVSP